MIANYFPLLQVFVQMEETDPISQSQWPRPFGRSATPEQQQSVIHGGRVTLQRRPLCTRQPVRDAIVYVVHLNAFANEGPGATPLERIKCELKQLVEVLRTNSAATLVLTSGLIPDLGSVGARVEARARLRDLTLSQLTNRQENEVSEVLAMLSTLGDSTGQLVLVNKNCSPISGDMALEIRYQLFTHG